MGTFSASNLALKGRQHPNEINTHMPAETPVTSVGGLNGPDGLSGAGGLKPGAKGQGPKKIDRPLPGNGNGHASGDANGHANGQPNGPANGQAGGDAGPDTNGDSETVNPNAAVGNVQTAYGAEQIQVLEGLDAVRKRPGMYIGGTGLNALHHLVYEVVDNSIDEAMAGHATFVDVTVQPDGSCRVIDDGRGIPTGPMKHEDPTLNGRPAIEIVLTKLHAGGKFQQEGSAYKVSGGLHGVGVSCVNALSEYLDAEVFRDGQIHRIGFERGRVTKPLHLEGAIPASATRTRGTTVTFRPDPTIFPDTTFDSAILSARLRELSFLNPGVTLRLSDERVGSDGQVRSESFRAKHGLLEYVAHLMTGKTPVVQSLYFRREDVAQSMVAEVAMQYHDGYNESLLSFANNINNVDGGTHAQGFKAALTRALNSYARKAGIIKDKDPVPTGEDLREGLIAIISVKLPNPTFNNQPKEKLLNPEIEGFVSMSVGEGLERWLEEHPAEARRLCLKAVVAAQAREAARKARELTRRKSALDSGSMPHKLRDCKTRDVDRSELFIVEGDSAGGSATGGRDVETQAILPLRGKILNVEKARIDRMLAFEEIRTLIAALRVGIGAEMDLSKLRYGKIIIMTDADVDGSHIRTLLLTFFFRQMPELIRRGHIYIAQPPLYQLAKVGSKTKKGTYVLSAKFLDDALMDLGLESSTLIVRDLVPAGTNGSPAPEAKESRRIEGISARRVVHLLRRMAELVEISQRRGVRFVDLLTARPRDPSGERHLPSHRVTWRGGAAFAWSEAEAMSIVAEKKLRLADWTRTDAATPSAAPAAAIDATAAAVAAVTSVTPVMPVMPVAPVTPVAPATGPEAVVRELHENRELDKIASELASMGLPVDAQTYAGAQGEAVTGEKIPARFAWFTTKTKGGNNAKTASSQGTQFGADDGEDGSDASEVASAEDDKSGKAAARTSGLVEAPNLPAILEALRDIGRRGLDIKRFKGLGEMDASQLWETTMDPTKRVLLKVTWDLGSQADSLFTVLMGEEVEPRRRFIEDHALEVKNLDV